MNKRIFQRNVRRRALMLIFTASSYLGFTPNAIADDRVDSLLSFYSARLGEHDYFSAPFTQYRYLSAFPNPLISNGSLAFAQPDRIRFHYKKPFESVILLNSGNFKRYRKQGNTFVEQPSLEIAAKAITQEVARYMGGDLTKSFPYEVSFAPGNDRHCTLVPLNPAAKAIFSRIELYFPDDASYVQRITLVEQSGDSIVVAHESPAFTPLPDSLFVKP